jgi:hypothetical protein
MRYDFAPLAVDATRFLSEQTGVSFYGFDFERWLCCTARGDLDEVIGVLVMEPRLWFDWYLSTAVIDARCVTKQILQAMFVAVFDHCGAIRVTAEVDPDNRHALKQMRRLGFVYEGFRRMGVEGNRDAMMFGMLRGDCPWLPGYAGGTIVPDPREVMHDGLHS